MRQSYTMPQSGEAGVDLSMEAKDSRSRFTPSTILRFARFRISPFPFCISQACRDSSGFALVIVLGILALVIVLAVGFISSVGAERAAAAGFHASVSTRQLADTAVSLVQGQINMATTQGSAVAWASQPGMVRTFNNTTGNLINAYKLYSATDMIGTAVSLAADIPPTTWATDTALWTDLNAPVEIEGVKNYPILDPSSLNLPQSPEGFLITSAPGGTAYQTAPMPVRWLYMLRDGQIVAPTETSGKTATIPGATNAKGANPIVGRIAFWTDDDTCKVNVNTTSEGTYWDTPRSQSKQEQDFAKKQPVQKEFQRYAGHPATTSLSAVFPALTEDHIYALAPRVQGGGSNAGTTLTKDAQPIDPNLDHDRLYASVDELLFQPDRTTNSAGLSKTQLEQSKFFLTARSRAPETNLFNLPRVAMWPIYKLGDTGTPNNAFTTAFDRLIAFCSSTGTTGSSSYHPYIFQRQDAYSATNDIRISRNIELLSYLSYLTVQPTPGFGGNFLAKYPDDRDQILTEIFDYIRSENLQDATLTTGSNRFTKPINTNGYGWVVPSHRGTGATQTMGFGRVYTLSELSLVFICNAAPDDPSTADVDESHGSNIPGNAVLGVPVGTPLALGKKYIQAMILPELFSPMQGFIAMAPDMQMTISGLETLLINETPIFPAINDSAYFTTQGGVKEYSKLGGSPTYRFFGFNGLVGKGSPARGNLASDSSDPKALYPFIGTPIKITAPPTGETMNFSGGTITVKLYADASTAAPVPANLIQTFTITFPSSTFPVPEIVPDGASGSPTTIPRNTAQNWWAFSKAGCISPAVAYTNTPAPGDYGTQGRLRMIGENVFSGSTPNSPLQPGSTYRLGAFIRPEYDTVRSMLPAHGDYRLVAASPSVTSFVNHRYYHDSFRHMAASLSGPNYSLRSQSLPGNDLGGKYISSVTYNPNNGSPDIPSDASGTNSPQSTGDFDRGLTTTIDGAYINKPDEGDITDSLHTPYFDATANDNLFVSVGTTFFSPNRQIPSSGMLGSLPTGIKAGVPWKTLLFRPQTSHPSYSSTIPDHLLMDLFWMPVVEPYAISDRFSTAGKINMNYQILPFTYITRSTGLMAVLKSELMAAIPKTRSQLYAGDVSLAAAGNDSYRYRLPIDRTTTLTQFENKFAAGQIFKSATEICDIHIVPQGQTVEDMETSFWTTNALTGDNLRERIYTTLYPRLTTKSNTFTVHFRVQSVQQVSSTTGGTWTDGKDVILGEYRGSTSLERFIDANNTNIPDYAAAPANIPSLDPLDKFYRWRVVENRKFAP